MELSTIILIDYNTFFKKHMAGITREYISWGQPQQRSLHYIQDNRKDDQ